MEWRVEKIEEFQPEYPNILNAVRWCREQQDWPTLAELAEHTWSYAYVLGLFSEMHEILEAANEAAQALNDERLGGRIILQEARLGEIQDAVHEDVLGKLEVAEQVALKFGNTADLGEVWATRISAYRFLARAPMQQGKTDEVSKIFAEAELWANRLLEEADRTKDLHLKYLGAIRSADIKAEQKEFEQALHWAEIAEQCALEMKATRVIANVLTRRGSILYYQGKYVEAERHLLKSLALRQHLGLRRHIAVDKQRLARVYIDMGNSQLARQYAHEAMDVFEQLGMIRLYSFTQKLLEQIPTD